ncbi:hypothetical protein [Mesorhizobium sp. A556]
MPKPRRAPLPDSLPPIGINREQAAAFIGISASLFDQLVHAGKMPDARVIASRLVWDVSEIEEAFRAIPHRSEKVGIIEDVNPWD